MQRFGLLYGLAFLSSPMDEELDFAKYSRIVLKGSMDDVAAFGDDAANDGLDIAECRLPESGKVYRARQTRDGIDIGYDLINQCQAYVDTLDALTLSKVLTKTAMHGMQQRLLVMMQPQPAQRTQTHL